MEENTGIAERTLKRGLRWAGSYRPASAKSKADGELLPAGWSGAGALVAWLAGRRFPVACRSAFPLLAPSRLWSGLFGLLGLLLAGGLPFAAQAQPGATAVPPLRPAAAPSPDAAPLSEAMTRRTQACTVCHGQSGRATNDGYYPRIAGKPAGYLYNQLVHFRDGRRTYPLMGYLLAPLSDAYLLEIAAHFAAQQPPYPPPPRVEVSASVLARGEALVLKGERSKKVPACVACHGERLTGVAPNIPGLLGLPRDYLNAQFGAWREGKRQAAQPDCMAQIAQRLSVEDISAASAWLATRTVPDDPTPVAQAADFRLPLECGSVALPDPARRP